MPFLFEAAPVSKLMAVLLCVTMLLSHFSTFVPRVFGFIPAHTLSVHSYPWNLVSYVVVEPNIVFCACSVAFLLSIGSAVEVSLGTFAFLQLVLPSAAVTSVSLLVLSAVLYAGGVFWFLQCYCGLWPVAASLLVAWLAAAPTASIGRFRLARHDTLVLFVAAALAVDLLRRREAMSEEDVDSDRFFVGSVLLPSLLGLTVGAWRRRVGAAVLLHPILSRWRRGASSAPGSYSHSNSMGGDGGVSLPVLRAAVPLPGSTEEEAERRRAIALAALQSRMQQQQRGAPPPTPNQQQPYAATTSHSGDMPV